MEEGEEEMEGKGEKGEGKGEGKRGGEMEKEEIFCSLNFSCVRPWTLTPTL